MLDIVLIEASGEYSRKKYCLRLRGSCFYVLGCTYTGNVVHLHLPPCPCFACGVRTALSAVYVQLSLHFCKRRRSHEKRTAGCMYSVRCEMVRCLLRRVYVHSVVQFGTFSSDVQQRRQMTRTLFCAYSVHGQIAEPPLLECTYNIDEQVAEPPLLGCTYTTRVWWMYTSRGLLIVFNCISTFCAFQWYPRFTLCSSLPAKTLLRVRHT